MLPIATEPFRSLPRPDRLVEATATHAADGRVLDRLHEPAAEVLCRFSPVPLLRIGMPSWRSSDRDSTLGGDVERAELSSTVLD